MRELRTPDGLLVRAAEQADTPAMSRVIQAAFPEWPPVEIDVSPLEFLEWKTNPPIVEPGQHTVVEYDGEIVALKTHWVARAQLYGSELTTDTGADFAVLPEFQGRGVSRLLNTYEEQADRPRGQLFFGSGTRAPAIEHMRQEAVVRPLRVWVRRLNWRAQVSTRLRSGDVAPLIREATGAVANTVRRLSATAAAGRVARLRSFDQRTDALWDAARSCFDLATIRDATYLNWRYADRRAGRRLLLGQLDRDHAQAYAVFQPAGSTLQLSDLLVHPDHPRAGVEVLRAGVAVGRQRGAAAVNAWVPPGHRDEAVYEAAGFVPAESPISVQHKPPRGVSVPDVMAKVARSDLREHLTMGDFDWT